MYGCLNKYRFFLLLIIIFALIFFGWQKLSSPKLLPVKPAPESASLGDDNTQLEETKKMTTTPSGLRIEVLTDSNGATPVKGNTIKAHYTGWLTDGTQFDSSHDRREPLEFKVGVGQVIAGWDEGLLAMKVGQTVKLHIPAALGYGARGAGRLIKPNSDLVFEVELVEIVK